MASRIARLEQLVEVLERRRRGDTIHEIARTLGVHPRTVQRRWAEALKTITDQTPDEGRRATEDRLDSVLRRLESLYDEAPAKERVSICNAILTVERDRARLYGLNMPASVVVAVEQAEGAGAWRSA